MDVCVAQGDIWTVLRDLTQIWLPKVESSGLRSHQVIDLRFVTVLLHSSVMVHLFGELGFAFGEFDASRRFKCLDSKFIWSFHKTSQVAVMKITRGVIPASFLQVLICNC